MWPEPVERVASFLRASAVEATIEELAQETATAEQAARALGCPPSRIVKTLVFVCEGEYVLGLVPGDRRAAIEKVAAAVSAREGRMADEREVVDATGFEPGAVAPFPRTSAGPVVIERTLLGHGAVWIGAGSPVHMASLAPGDLLRLTNARAADLVSP